MSRSRLIEATSAMPFAGRHIVRSSFLAGREAGREGRVGGKIASVAFLGIMAAGHALQMKMGIQQTLAHAHESTPLGAIEAGYDALYATANAAVTYTQAYLGAKVLATGRALAAVGGGDTSVASIADAPKPPDRFTFSERNLPVDMAATLGAQVLFLATTM